MALEQVEEALDEDGGLAGAGARLDEQRAAFGRDGVACWGVSFMPHLPPSGTVPAVVTTGDAVTLRLSDAVPCHPA